MKLGDAWMFGEISKILRAINPKRSNQVLARKYHIPLIKAVDSSPDIFFIGWSLRHTVALLKDHSAVQRKCTLSIREHTQRVYLYLADLRIVNR